MTAPKRRSASTPLREAGKAASHPVKPVKRPAGFADVRKDIIAKFPKTLAELAK
jgi:hypothetical protein